VASPSTTSSAQGGFVVALRQAGQQPHPLSKAASQSLQQSPLQAALPTTTASEASEEAAKDVALGGIPAPSPETLFPAIWRGANSARVPQATREALQEKMKQEAWVMRRVRELSKEGRWAPKRLAKVAERPRPRTHWDNLLQEAQWLSVDFYQERQWKIAAARMLAYSAKDFVTKWDELKRRRREEEERRRRRRASFAAAAVEDFWADAARLSQVERVTGVEITVGNVHERHPPFSTSLYKASSEQGENIKKQSVKKPEGIREKGILVDEDRGDDDDSNEEEEPWVDDESTISEQEREEALDPQQTSDAKELIFDANLPLKSILPDDYPHSTFAYEEAREESPCSLDSADEDGDNDSISSIGAALDELSGGALLDLLAAEASLGAPLLERTIRVKMGSSQRRLYEDFLATPTSQTTMDQGDVSCVAALIGALRRICNHPVEAMGSSPKASTSLTCLELYRPNVSRVADFAFPHRVLGALDYQPFHQFDLTSLNMVFLAHESTLTAITSNRIKQTCATGKVIQALPRHPQPSVVSLAPPPGRIDLELSVTQRGFLVSGKAVAHSDQVKVMVILLTRT